MRVSREKCAENRERILEAAARLFREKGFDGIGVADIMKAAGMTHGGFYGHFASKDDLIAQASARAADVVRPQWQTLAREAPETALSEIVASYLSKAHRDAPECGCVFAALGPEIARQAPETRATATSSLKQNIAAIEALSSGATAAERHAAALATFSTLVGALVLARLSSDEKLSEDFLEAARAAIVGKTASGD